MLQWVSPAALVHPAVLVRRAVLALTVLISLSVSSGVRADLSPAERATAEALFQRGVTLVEEGDYEGACTAFAATLELEKGLGTMLRLADCYDRQDKTASAWALFKEVASNAALANDAVREQIAKERVTELESRLSLIKLSITQPIAKVATPSAAPPVPTVVVAGITIPKPMWDAAFPIDPGSQTVEVSAPGYQTWSSTIEVPSGPALMALTSPALNPETPAQEPNIDVFAARTTLPTKTRAQRASSDASSKPKAPSTESSYRPLGYAFTIVGLIAVATSGYLTYQAHTLNEQSRTSCQPRDPNACTPHGVDVRKEAQWYADVATITGASGGVLTVAGLAIVVFAPSAPRNTNQRGGAPLAVGLRTTW